jgi:hypothetical protein
MRLQRDIRERAADIDAHSHEAALLLDGEALARGHDSPECKISATVAKSPSFRKKFRIKSYSAVIFDILLQDLAVGSRNAGGCIPGDWLPWHLVAFQPTPMIEPGPAV